MKRFFRRVMCCAAWLLLLTTPARAVSTSASSAVLMEAQSGRVLYEQDAYTPRLIASTTKLLTALTALRHYDLGETVTVSPAAAATEGSSMYLAAGETLTVETLLYGLLLQSGNDAAEALAQHCGERERFIQWMNDLAKEIGMEDSHFENPSGLDGERHLATAYDMAKLMCAVLREPTLARIVSTSCATVGERTMSNHNKLLGQLEGCVGGKTGYTRAAGRTLVSAVQREGRTLVAVTLCDGNDWADHAALYEFGFSQPQATPQTTAPAVALEEERTGIARWLEKLRAWL